MIRRYGGPGMHGMGGIPLSALGGIGQGAATPFVGAYDAIANLVHVYEPARCTLSAYTGGNLLRLRRASDDAESDFSHVSAFDPELDLAAIAAWAGGASYIVTVYDQIGSDNITQATKAAQPLFVASMQNGHAGGRFNGTSHCLRGAFTTGGALSQPFSVYAAAALDAAAVNDGVNHLVMDGDDVTNRIMVYANGGGTPDNWAINAGTALTGSASNSNWHVWAALLNGASSQFWHDAASLASGNAGTQNPDGVTVGASFGSGVLWDGDWVMSAIADPSHSDAQRGAMQTAINAYWAVY